MNEQDLTELDPTTLESGSDLVRVALRDCQLTPLGLDDVVWEESLLAKVHAPAVPLRNLRLSDVIVRGCDFANGVWERTELTAVGLSKCRLTGWNVAEGVFRRVQWADCKIDLAVFQNATLTDCVFQACDLREVDFQSARLKNVTFRRCDLRSARFAAASLKTVDFRGSHLAGIQVDAASLSGNVFDPAQVLDVVQVFGIVVRELERGGLT